MAFRDFRLLSDILPTIRSFVDQPASDPAQMAFTPAQFSEAANIAHDNLHRLASQLDMGWTTRETTISALSGASFVQLPDDTRGLRATMEWDAAKGRKKRDIAVGEWGQLGRRDYDALWKPNDNTLRFLKPLPRPLTIRLVYDYHPLRLIHGKLPVDAGALAFKLADYEPRESLILNGTTLYIVEDPGGAAYGFKPIADWNGKTQVATFGTAWAPIPKKGATYTSPPDLPRDWEYLFALETAVVLGLKLPDNIVSRWKALRDEAALTGKHQVGTLDRRAAKIIRARASVGTGFTGDPINGPHWN